MVEILFNFRPITSCSNEFRRVNSGNTTHFMSTSAGVRVAGGLGVFKHFLALDLMRLGGPETRRFTFCKEKLKSAPERRILCCFPFLGREFGRESRE